MALVTVLLRSKRMEEFRMEEICLTHRTRVLCRR